VTRKSTKCAALLAIALVGAGAGTLVASGHAQGIPGLSTGTTGTTEKAPPAAPPVASPGALGDATTHEAADAARRGAVADGGLHPPLRSLWRQDFEAPVSHVVVGDGRVYVLSGDHVAALDLATGQRLWTSADRVSPGGLAFGGGRLVSGGDPLVALDAATGNVAWKVEGRSPGGSPLIAGDLVIDQDQGLAAYDLASGQKRWQGGDGDGVDGVPAASGDRIFQIGGCTIAAVDRRDGHVIWRRNGGCSGGSSGTVALQGDLVHSSFTGGPLAASDGQPRPGAEADILVGDIGLQREPARLTAMSLAGGQLLWTADNAGFGAPLAVGDNIFETQFAGGVRALALANGVVTWAGRLRPASEASAGSTDTSAYRLAAGGGILLVARGSSLDALGAAPAPPASLSLKLPEPSERTLEMGEKHPIEARAGGDLWPNAVVVEADPYPFGAFKAMGAPLPLDANGQVHATRWFDRNTRVRLVGADGGAQPTRSYTVLVYPRIRLGLRNVANRITTKVRVNGSSALRYRGRRVHLYHAQARKRRMVKLGSVRLRGPSRGSGHGVIHFPAIRHAGTGDFLYACVPGVHRLGQGAADPAQRRCGRRTIRFS
jgi:hypothetical protein